VDGAPAALDALQRAGFLRVTVHGHVSDGGCTCATQIADPRQSG
jgi:hypothetical protein